VTSSETFLPTSYGETNLGITALAQLREGNDVGVGLIEFGFRIEQVGELPLDRLCGNKNVAGSHEQTLVPVGPWSETLGTDLFLFHRHRLVNGRNGPCRGDIVCHDPR